MDVIRRVIKITSCPYMKDEGLASSRKRLVNKVGNKK